MDFDEAKNIGNIKTNWKEKLLRNTGIIVDIL